MVRRPGRTRNTVLTVLFVILLAAAVALSVFSEPLCEMQRAEAIAQVLTVLDGGVNAVDIAADVYPLYGEEDAARTLTGDAAALCGTAVPEQTLSEGRVALHMCGVLSIPRISATLPVYVGAGRTALRFGVGLVSVPDAGVTVLFGYRTRVSGRLLHDLDALAVGDGVTLAGLDKVRTAYTVASVRLTETKNLEAELSAPPDGCTLVLVSGHPAGESTHRILVWLKRI